MATKNKTETNVEIDAGELNPDAPDMTGAKPAVMDDDTDTVSIKVTSADQSPVRLTVNGRSVVLTVNKVEEMPRYFLDALRDSNIVFEVVSK